MRIILVVPCYNEAERLDPRPFEDWLGGQPDAKVLFVDDGSTDATAEVLRGMPGRVVSLEANRGKAEAVRAGMLAALAEGSEAIAVWDADLSAPLAEIDAMAQRLAARPDLLLVMGSRVLMLGADIERSALRHYVGRGFATAASIALSQPVYDTQCGAKLWRATEGLAALLDEPFGEPWLYDVELLARLISTLAEDAPVPVEELPLRRWHHSPGSKVSPLDLFRALRALARVRHRYPRLRR